MDPVTLHSIPTVRAREERKFAKQMSRALSLTLTGCAAGSERRGTPTFNSPSSHPSVVLAVLAYAIHPPAPIRTSTYLFKDAPPSLLFRNSSRQFFTAACSSSVDLPCGGSNGVGRPVVTDSDLFNPTDETPPFALFPTPFPIVVVDVAGVLWWVWSQEVSGLECCCLAAASRSLDRRLPTMVSTRPLGLPSPTLDRPIAREKLSFDKSVFVRRNAACLASIAS